MSDELKTGPALTREILEKGFQGMREMSEARRQYYAEGGKPFLTPTPEIYRLARECDYDLEGSFNLIHPIRLSDLEDDEIIL